MNNTDYYYKSNKSSRKYFPSQAGIGDNLTVETEEMSSMFFNYLSGLSPYTVID